jgi:hypothetical protein
MRLAMSDRIRVCCDFQMTNGLWFVTVRDKTAKAKKCGACGKKVKRYDNAQHEEKKQRFFKKSHRELGFV